VNVETVLRRIEKECRDTIKTYDGYEPRWQGGKGAVMRGAVSEARGAVDMCGEFRQLCRNLRAEHSLSRATERSGRKGARV
jgi:hypothetical protein